MTNYLDFLKNKMAISSQTGFDVGEAELTPTLFPHVKDTVRWAVKGGCRAIFSSFGMQKTVTQLEILRIIIKHKGGKGLIVCPKRVVVEFVQQAKEHMGMEVTYVRTMSEVKDCPTDIMITNYERVRDGEVGVRIDPSYFTVTSLDEASVLRGYGTKTYQEFLPFFANVPYRFVATATPSPNRYKELIHYAGYLGIMDTGQAQPLSSKILTPNGWKKMGDIKIGDYVIGQDGKPTKVTEIIPHGEQDVYEVMFSDGSLTKCSAEHLWETQTQYQRNACAKFKKRHPIADIGKYWTVKTTREIADTLICSSTGSKNHSIPMVEPVLFENRDVEVDPYLLGLLLGDGNLRETSINFTTPDSFLVEKIAEIVGKDGLEIWKDEHTRKDSQCNYDYHISGRKDGKTGRNHHSNQLLNGLRGYGLLGKRSWEKFVPYDYRFNSVDVRLAVLRGLMDTDGTICKNEKVRTPVFTTASKQLADNVKFIVQSLGGTCHTSERTGVKPNGDKGRLQYKVSFMLPNGTNPFLLPRKAELVTERKKYRPMRYIVSVKKVGREEVQCINVDNDRHLYVTDDFICTHNCLTRFFQRDSTKANNLTLYKGKENEFWLWVSTWALFLTKPSDLGYSDEGYILPPLNVHEEVVDVDNETAGYFDDGVKMMFRESALGLRQASKEKRDSIMSRVQRVVEIINRPENKDDHFLLWHDLEAERYALCKAIPGCKAVYGSQNDDETDRIISNFKDGKLKYLAAKPEMLGEGLNFQYHCHKAIMFIDYRFNDKYQAIARIHRFMQKHPVDLYIVYAESEQEIYKTFNHKWQQHKDMVAKMVKIIRDNGLFGLDVEAKLMRYMFSQREEKKGKLFTAINNDNVLECSKMEENSVDLIVTSVPFSNHYEYTASYNDFGYNADNDEFFKQMDYLTPHLLRILRPGRVLAVHVKDRILFGNATGLGMPSLDPFHAMCIFHYMKHGFILFGMITVDTDVVRENNQTYRLGYTEMRKDGSKMGVGCPEYILLFRKLPTDTTRAYADVPVTKEKEDYSLAKWQIDAHADWKSSGNCLLSYDDVKFSSNIGTIRAFYRNFAKSHTYNYAQHVKFAEDMEKAGKLPKDFMAIDPVSHKEWIWDDVTRMRTLNSRQSQKNLRMHVCPLQLDIVERLIERYSNKGDLVFDPFGGIGTVPYCAVKMGRKGLSTELNYDYWRDSLIYLKEAECDITSPTLFDFLDEAM